MKILRIFGLIVVLTAAAASQSQAAPTSPEQPVLRRDTVVVNSDMIRLGDLFEGAGDKAETPVAYAPSPGRRALFDARWLFRVAQGYGLDWRPASLHEKVTVERDSTIVDRQDIEQHILHALANEGVNIDQASVRLSNPMLQLHMPADANPDLRIEDITYDPRRGRFAALVNVSAEGASDQRMRVTGQLQETVEVPVLARRVAPGEVISANDVRWIEQHSRAIRRNTVTNADDLIGRTPKRAVRPGVPINLTDVQAPVAVGKGDLVTIVFETPQMQLTARGQALEDGSRGEAIRVTNVHSRQIIEAMVRGPGTVIVGSASPLYQ